MRKHTLKVQALYWDAIKAGDVTFEVRRNDLHYQKGDILILQKWSDWNGGGYEYEAGSEPLVIKKLYKVISYVMPGGDSGIECGYAVLGLRDAAPQSF